MRDATISGIGDAPSRARPPSYAAAGYKNTFTIHDLSAVRRTAAEQGRRAGLDAGRLSDFVLAVNEVATNAVCHGCDRARLRLWVTKDAVCCEVSGGTWASAASPSAAPDDAARLRLWVVWQVCTEVTMSYGPDEATVLLSISTRTGR